MGGLAGLLRRDGAHADRSVVARMLDAMRHRGPDGATVTVRGPVALGHLALETTPGAKQSAVGDALRGVWLVFDGRLDNRDEIARALGVGAADARVCDPALVLEAYTRWGEQACARLIGDFALALWDDRRRTLLCARDPLGIRPFYYHAGASAFLWASEPQALFADEAVTRRPNEGFLAECLANQPTSLDETVFADIRRLPAAHALIVSPQGQRVWRYWDPEPVELRGLTDDAYADRLRETIGRAVAARLRGPAAVGAHLSGGLDSSTVVATALEVIRGAHVDAQTLHPFSMVSPGRSFDETEAISTLERHLGLRTERIDPSPIDVRCALEWTARYSDLPDVPTGEPLFEKLLARTRARGLRVLLTGAGGDQWLGGSPLWLADLVRSRQWATLWRALPGAVDRESVVGGFVHAGVLPLVPPRWRRGLRRVLRMRRTPAWVARDFARRVNLDDRLSQPPLTPIDGSYARADLKRLITSGWEALLKEQLDRTAAWYGVEHRHPFYDRRVVELLLALPETQRQGPGRSKVVLRSAMRTRLPEALVASEAKVDFGELFIEGMNQLGGARFFEPLGIAEAGWVDALRVREMSRRAHQAGRAGGYAGLLFPLWMIMSVEHWFRVIILGDGRRGSVLAEFEPVAEVVVR